MKWDRPPLNKIYEALGAIGDNRIEIDGNNAKVYSSSRKKYYDVSYDPASNSITSNDNGSFYVGYLGYPAIAFLLSKGIIEFDSKLTDYLSGFYWKDINKKFKNDFDKTNEYIDARLTEMYNIDLGTFHAQLEELLVKVMDINLRKLENGQRPPSGY